MIEAQGLTKFYGSVPAINDVTFTVEKGEVVGFLGPNGAGKSTTLRILTCYMPPTLGVAKVGGFDCFEQSLEVRRQIGYLPENVPLYGDMSVNGFLRFAAAAKGVNGKEIDKEVSRVVDVCGLGDVTRRMIAYLSKGFRQRVGLAQALLNNPPVLILDEPTIGLDPAQIVEIRRLIQELRENHTILLSSHILPEVAQICQRVVIINKGKIVATDTPANLTSQLQKAWRISLTVGSKSDDLVARIRNLEGVLKVSWEDNGTRRLMVEADRTEDLRPQVARIVIEQGVELYELKSMDLSLEEIFMQLVTEEEASIPEETEK